MRRRPLLLALPLLALAQPARALPPRTLVFPRDHGAHPALRTEWWYITGHARAAEREFGFQLTFFRSRVDATQGMQSNFAARQLIFAHAAVTDLAGGKLWHDERIARAGFGIAAASEHDTDVRLRNWSLQRDAGTGAYSASLPAGEFALTLAFTPTQPLLLQGQQGLSRKGPEPRQASYYYSQPQLAARGRIRLQAESFEVSGRGWLDHEWSEKGLLHPDAVGWDWIGMNLDDGSALTAFRLRRQDGSALWAGGSFRSADGKLQVFDPGQVVFSPQRLWTSPLSRAVYPVAWQVRTPAGVFTVKPLLDNQELDSRSSTGAIYWEGLCELWGSGGERVGRGYLEMTGYAQPLRI
jgi:predicted secreted hydrolase